MKLLAEISDKSLGLDDIEILGQEYTLRKSARAVLINDEGLIATQYLNKYEYHKLPGGGVELGETIEEALKREVLEEVGCECEIIQPLGITIGYRNKYKMLHISYGFAAKVAGEIGNTALEAGEIEEGQETMWLEPEKLLHYLKTDQPLKYEGYFILPRETAFLSEYLNK